MNPTSASGDARIALLQRWLNEVRGSWQLDPESLTPASSDASFRRYFRVASAHPEHASLIVMDAPPQYEDCRPFIQVSALFDAAGVHVPRVLEQNLQDGFLLLSDLGRTTYLNQLNADNASRLYADASDALIRIQLGSRASVLPDYDRTRLQRELDLFPQWYLGKHLGATLSDAQQADLRATFETLLRNNLAQPQVWVHRDYHSRNLMVCANGNPGVLDFQDAVYGPITYDAASLWRDAYIQWDEEQQLDWLIRYWEKARRAGLPVDADFGQFYRDFEWMGLQRHLKVLGIFARLFHRDGKNGYLKDLPLVLHYTRQVAGRYREFGTLARLLDELEGVEVKTGYTF